MSGEVSIDRRLSPSGRHIRNALDGSLNPVDAGKLLPIGSGTPGLIWRGQFTGAPTNIGGTSSDPPVVLAGQGGAWALPAGYRYDYESFVTVHGKASPTAGDLVVAVEGSTDGGATYTVPLMLVDIPTVYLAANEAACFTFAHPANTPLTVDITHVRTRALFVGVAPTDVAVINDSWTKIIQYVV
jgi:hypothetical protein